MLGFKKHNIVIMEGSSKFVNHEILGMVDCITNRRISRTRCQKFDGEHPTMFVIERVTTPRRFHTLKQLIEKVYPGICAFDVPM